MRTLEVRLSAGQPLIKHFTANPKSIVPGKSAVLKWSVTNASTVRISPAAVDDFKPTGFLKVAPAVTTVYTLTASERGEEAVSKLTVTVVPARITPVKIVGFKGDKPVIDSGDDATLTWSVTGDVRSIDIDQGIGHVNSMGSRKVSPTTKTTYTLSVKDAGGATFTQAYTVDVLKPPKIEDFKVDNNGETPVLRWRISGAERATRIHIEPDIGTVPPVCPPDGLPLKSPPADLYTLTVEGPGARIDSKSAPARAQPAAREPR
jgi:hypothetical protein